MVCPQHPQESVPTSAAGWLPDQSRGRVPRKRLGKAQRETYLVIFEVGVAKNAPKTVFLSTPGLFQVLRDPRQAVKSILNFHVLHLFRGLAKILYAQSNGWDGQEMYCSSLQKRPVYSSTGHAHSNVQH